MVVEAAEEPSDFHFLYELNQPIRNKIETIAKEIYGAAEVVYEPEAAQQIRSYERNGFGNLPIWGDPVLLVFVGSVGVSTGLLYPVVPVKAQNSYARFFVGVLLAVGSFFILAGVEKAIGSLAIDSFVIVLSVLWVVSKIRLSRWEHNGICARCSYSFCSAKSRF